MNFNILRWLAFNISICDRKSVFEVFGKSWVFLKNIELEFLCVKRSLAHVRPFIVQNISIIQQ